MQDFSVWISAAMRAPGESVPANDATDVIVNLPDGSRWAATFCAFAYVDTLRERWAARGECLGGRYLWMARLVLAEDTSRETTEAVVRDLIASGEFRSSFTPAPAQANEAAI